MDDQATTGAVVESTKPVETPIAAPTANNSVSVATPGNTDSTTNAAPKPGKFRVFSIPRMH